MRTSGLGTTAAASSMSALHVARHAPARRRAPASRARPSRPSGLSSRTTSPVSVTQDVRGDAGELRAHAEGRHRPAARRARPRAASTSITIGALRSVAGSKTRQLVVRARREPGGGQAARRLSDSAGGSVSSRVSVRVPAAVCDREVEPLARRRRRSTSIGAGAGIERELERAQRERAVDARRACAGGRRVVAPSSAICSRPSSCSSKPSSVGTVWLTVKPIFSPR